VHSPPGSATGSCAFPCKKDRALLKVANAQECAAQGGSPVKP
jgi:hypothetical protein